MGGSESTGRSNGTQKEEEERRRQQQSGGGFTKAATAATIVAGVAVAAWGISRMLSDDTDSEEKEKDDAMAIKARGTERSLPDRSIRRYTGYEGDHQPSIQFSHPPDRFKINTDGEYNSTKGKSSGYGGVFQYEGNYMGYDGAKKLSMWQPPPRGLFKMNTDGACRPSAGGLSGYGGILRKDDGEWVCGFYGSIGSTDVLTAEIHGIHKGLLLLDKLGYKKSILETDSQAAFKWVTEPKDGPSKSKIICDCWNIITECRELIRVNEIDIKIIVGKHANRCADKLAAIALKKREEYMELKDVPNEIKEFIDKDKIPHEL